MERLKDVFRPYTFQDFVEDANPQTWSELKELERTWHSAHNSFNNMH